MSCGLVLEVFLVFVDRGLHYIRLQSCRTVFFGAIVEIRVSPEKNVLLFVLL